MSPQDEAPDRNFEVGLTTPPPHWASSKTRAGRVGPQRAGCQADLAGSDTGCTVALSLAFVCGCSGSSFLGRLPSFVGPGVRTRSHLHY